MCKMLIPVFCVLRRRHPRAVPALEGESLKLPSSILTLLGTPPSSWDDGDGMGLPATLVAFEHAYGFTNYESLNYFMIMIIHNLPK